MPATRNQPEAWRKALIGTVETRLSRHPYWALRTSTVLGGANALHLAVFVEPFLGFILKGKKTVESRFSIKRIAPYQLVQPGDAILLKRSGGAVVGISEVSYVWYYELDKKAFQIIRDRFGAAMCAETPRFWEERSSASFATLILLDHVIELPPVICGKKDRRGWVLLSPEDKHRQI